MSIERQIRVRFAPSPTGNLHIGGLRTALFNWLFARHSGGVFLLRIEDTDLERSTQEYRDSILNSFAWAGLEHDEEIITQSDRIEEHRRIAYDLIKVGKAYRCFCSPEDVVARYEANHKDNAFVMYDGHCRDRVACDGDEQRAHVVRFKLPTDCTEIIFEDLIKGPMSFALDQLDDFIILRSGGYPMYNFVVVIDDAFMRITHIIRGEEHLVNTPKQILLYQACGYEVPLFAHLPLILGPSGEKLSKRDGATSVIEYCKEGYVPQALLNYLARLGWSHGNQEIFSLSELIEYFSLEHIGTKGSIFDFEKLAWVNSVYIHEMDAQDLLNIIVRHIEPDFVARCSLWNNNTIKNVITLYQERVKTIKALAQEVMLVHNGPAEYNAEDVQKWMTADAGIYLDTIITVLENTSILEHDDLFAVIKDKATLLGVKLVSLLQPVRLALIGKSSGPGVFDLLLAIGKEQSIARLRSLRATFIV